MTEREKFEKWVKDHYQNNRYMRELLLTKKDFFEMWQAAATK